MLVSISRPPIALVAGTDPTIEAMVNLMPDYSAGRRLHALYVNKIQAELPGNYSQLFGTGPAFRGVFFPGWQPDGLLGLTGDTGLDQAWWSNFSVVVLCQAIADMGSDIRGQMVTGQINADLGAYNATLRTRSARVYANVLAATYGPLVALLGKVDRATAKQQFHDSLLDNVINRQLWYQAGMWTSPDWEMFNQYAKYIALGASDAEVDTLIGQLIAAGLPVPPVVNQQGWRTYSEELRDKPNIDLDDIRSQCAGPITASTYLPTYGGMPARMPNGNCYEFTANSQPGNRYRRAPGGCCFTPDTQVLNAAGEAVPIRDVKRGDTVLTRDGTATVAYVACPVRGERGLYRLTGGGPVFTGTHPFLNAAPPDPDYAPPTVLAVDPQTLAWMVPTLSDDGIGRLTSGSLVLSRAAGGGQAPAVVAVTGVEEVTPTGADTYLYDLRLETRTGERQDFWAGDGETFYLVSPEYPVLDQAGASLTTAVALMEGLLASGGPAGTGWPPPIIDAVNEFGAGIFLDAAMQALATTPSFGAVPPTVGVYERIDRIYRSLAGATEETAAVIASLFDGLLAAVGQWLTSVIAVGWRTSLLLGGDILTITVFDLALLADNPIPADATVQLEITVTGRQSAEGTRMWDRRGRANTRFHHYFDQLLHIDLAGDDRPLDLSFAVLVDGAALPSLFAEAPAAVDDSTHVLQSAQLRDSSGAVVGTVRFDTRRLGRDAAAQELLSSGLWTEEVAEAYADALGKAMVEPILSRLRAIPAGMALGPGSY